MSSTTLAKWQREFARAASSARNANLSPTTRCEAVQRAQEINAHLDILMGKSDEREAIMQAIWNSLGVD